MCLYSPCDEVIWYYIGDETLYGLCGKALRSQLLIYVSHNNSGQYIVEEDVFMHTLSRFERWVDEQHNKDNFVNEHDYALRQAVYPFLAKYRLARKLRQLLKREVK